MGGRAALATRGSRVIQWGETTSTARGLGSCRPSAANCGPARPGARAKLTSGALIEILPKYRSIEIDIHAVYPSRKHVPPKVRLMIDFLVEAFRRPRWPA